MSEAQIGLLPSASKAQPLVRLEKHRLAGCRGSSESPPEDASKDPSDDSSGVALAKSDVPDVALAKSGALAKTEGFVLPLSNIP